MIVLMSVKKRLRKTSTKYLVLVITELQLIDKAVLLSLTILTTYGSMPTKMNFCASKRRRILKLTKNIKRRTRETSRKIGSHKSGIRRPFIKSLKL